MYPIYSLYLYDHVCYINLKENYRPEDVMTTQVKFSTK